MLEMSQTYFCSLCERPVYFPEILYDDGRCEECHNPPA